VQDRRKNIDLTGQTFGKLYVKGEGPRVKNKPTWSCLCLCGIECTATTHELLSSRKKSCGHLRGHSRDLDLTGQVFYDLTVLYKLPNKITKPETYGKSMWRCLCICGKECDIQTNDLTSGRRKDCGHSHDAYMHKPRTIDITGNIYGYLQVQEMLPSIKVGNKWRAMCRCLCLLCGNIIDLRKDNLISGDTKSCGCIKSVGEQTVLNYLIENKIPHVRQFYFQDLLTPKNAYCYFDFCILNEDRTIKCLIEYQGIQHYEEYNGPESFGLYSREITDPLKREYCKKHNIALFEIKYDSNIIDELNKILAC